MYEAGLLLFTHKLFVGIAPVCLISVGPLLVGQAKMTAVLGPRQSNGLARAQR